MSDALKNIILKEIQAVSEEVRRLDELSRSLRADFSDDKYYCYLLGKKESLSYILNLK